PDVLCLQETKSLDKDFPAKQLNDLGYEFAAFTGERAYNGVAIISKYPLTDLVTALPDRVRDEQKRFIAATVNGTRVVNVYVPHGTKFGSEKFEYKLKWIKRLKAYFEKNFTLQNRVVLCGDLNVAPHELDVWNPNGLKDKLHFTKTERLA